MPDYDEKQAHRDIIEYYRLVLAANKNDPCAAAVVKADEAVLAMVKETPGVVEMNEKMMAGGLAYDVTRGIAVDGANVQAAVYEELDEEPLTELWRKRAQALAKAKNMDELYAVSEQMDAEEAPVKESEARLKTICETVIEKVLLAEAAPPGTAYDDSEKQTLAAHLDELAERYPGVRWPALLEMPRLRKRLAYDDKQLVRLSELFEKVNAERLGGRY